MKDKVNNHYFEIFGASIALGLIAGAGEITQGGGTTVRHNQTMKDDGHAPLLANAC